MMFVCRCDKLASNIRALIDTDNDCSKLVKHLTTVLRKGTEIAAIVHDKDYKFDIHKKKVFDTDEKPVLVPPHVHVAVHFPNPRSKTALAKAMQEPAERIKTCQNVKSYDGRNGRGNMFSYLLHLTAEARKIGKRAYNMNQVAANFNFENVVYQATEGSAKARAAKLETEAEEDELLLAELKQDIEDGKVKLAELPYNLLLQRLYPDNKQALLNADEVYKKRVLQAQALISSRDPQKMARGKKMLDELKVPQTLIDNTYVWGPAGSGKTYFAMVQANGYDNPEKPLGPYVAAGNKNIFDGYNDQSVIILDDMRPNSLSAQELLTLLDPHQHVKTLHARYHSKTAIGLSAVFMTNTQSPDEFFRYVKGKNSLGDPVAQYFRRLTYCVKLDEPLLIKGKRIVSYQRYTVTYKQGIGKKWFDNEELNEVKTLKKNKCLFLKVYERTGSEGTHTSYEVTTYSDYYLKPIGKKQHIIIPDSVTDDSSIQTQARLRAEKTLEEQNEQAMSLISVDNAERELTKDRIINDLRTNMCLEYLSEKMGKTLYGQAIAAGFNYQKFQNQNITTDETCLAIAKHLNNNDTKYDQIFDFANFLVKKGLLKETYYTDYKNEAELLQI